MKAMKYKNLRYGSNYPAQCPPEDCYLPNNEVVYRACKAPVFDKNGNLNMDNFVPVWEDKRKNFPKKKICMAKALSFFLTPESCLLMLIDFPKNGNKIMKIKLHKNSGYFRKTGNNENHSSLWDLSSPTICESIGKDWRIVVKWGWI